MADHVGEPHRVGTIAQAVLSLARDGRIREQLQAGAAVQPLLLWATLRLRSRGLSRWDSCGTVWRAFGWLGLRRPLASKGFARLLGQAPPGIALSVHTPRGDL